VKVKVIEQCVEIGFGHSSEERDRFDKQWDTIKASCPNAQASCTGSFSTVARCCCTFKQYEKWQRIWAKATSGPKVRFLDNPQLSCPVYSRLERPSTEL
jgi:hypothetical protein